MTKQSRGNIKKPSHQLTRQWLALTVALTSICLALNAWSQAFSRNIAMTDRPVLLLAVVLVASGFVFLLTVPLVLRSLAAGQTLQTTLPRMAPPYRQDDDVERPHSQECALVQMQQKTILWIIVAGGLAMRLALFGSTPLLEDDSYRYLWDGGVTAHGYNPYAASPDDAQGEPYYYSLQPLAHQSGIVIERINHSELTTVYPPVAQAAFALAHIISPWSLEAWRVVCLAAEAATLLLLLTLLDQTGRSRLWVALYWLSPLAAKEFINSAHMDSIVMPLVLGAALLSLKQRHLSAVATLGLAIGAKFWPLLLAPIILRPLLANPRRLAMAALLLAAFCLAATLPMLAYSSNETSGLAAYATYWRNNSAHYGLIETAFAAVLKPFQFDERIPGLFTRVLLAGLAGAFALWTALKPVENGMDIMRRLCLVTAAAVLLSPSQFPWYALWVLPLLVFAPWSGLLLMTALISIYYAGFHYLAREIFYIYREAIVFLIWLPVWALLAFEAWRINVSSQPPLIESSSGTPHA